MGVDTASFDERYRKFLPKIQQFRLMDDTFMSQVFQNKACTEFRGGLHRRRRIIRESLDVCFQELPES